MEENKLATKSVKVPLWHNNPAIARILSLCLRRGRAAYNILADMYRLNDIHFHDAGKIPKWEPPFTGTTKTTISNRIATETGIGLTEGHLINHHAEKDYLKHRTEYLLGKCEARMRRKGYWPIKEGKYKLEENDGKYRMRFSIPQELIEATLKNYENAKPYNDNQKKYFAGIIEGAKSILADCSRGVYHAWFEIKFVGHRGWNAREAIKQNMVDPRQALLIENRAGKNRFECQFTYTKVISQEEKIRGRQLEVGINPDTYFLRAEIPGINPDKTAWGDELEYQSVLRPLKRLDGVIKSINNGYKCAGDKTARHGHGLERKHQKVHSLQEKRVNLCKTFNHQRTAFIVKRAQQWKCETIACVDMTKVDKKKTALGEWPWFQFMTMLEQKANSNGIQFRRVPPAEAFVGEICEEIFQ